MSIYPSKEELRGATEAYLRANHIEFFDSFAEIRWTSYYNDNIHKNVSSFLLNLYINKNINILSKVVEASSILARIIGNQNKRISIHNLR
jgi:hypothetical protein